jgi:hypothetical protein
MRKALFILVLLLGARPSYAQPPAQPPVQPRAQPPAQPPARPPELRGTSSVIGGFGETLDDEGSLGRGWLAGGAIDRRMFGNTRAEVSLEMVTHNRHSGVVQSSGQTVTGGVSLVHRLGSGKVQPYIFEGLTIGHHWGTNHVNGDSVFVTSTDTGVRFGVGFAIRAGQRLEISPEVRLNGFWIDKGADPATLPSFGVRFGWRRESRGPR